MARHSGLSENVIENIESGRPDAYGERRRDITVDELMAIAEAFNLVPEFLLPQPVPADPVVRAEMERRRRARQAKIETAMRTLDQEQERFDQITSEIAQIARKMDFQRDLIRRLQTED